MTSEKREREVSERRLTPLEAAANAVYDHMVKAAVKSIEKKQIDYQLICTVEQNIARESDRSCAIILYSVIDELMHGLILEECDASVPRLKNRMFDPQSGMLPNSAKRIFFAISLRWITKETFHKLNIIRKIRNEFAHNILCDSFDYVKIRGLLSSMTPVDKARFGAAVEAAFAAMGIPEKLGEVLAEHDKKGRFFFVAECALLMERLIFEMCVFPEAQRRQINPVDVMRGYPNIPTNLRETGYNAMALLLRVVEMTFDLGVTINDFLPPAKKRP